MGTYTFERDERLLRGDYIDKTHAHAHNRASILLLLFEALVLFSSRSITRKEKRRGEKERTFFPRYILEKRGRGRTLERERERTSNHEHRERAFIGDDDDRSREQQQQQQQQKKGRRRGK